MSSKAHPYFRLVRSGLVLLAVASLSVGAASAQRKTFFNPAVSFGATVTNNADYAVSGTDTDVVLGGYLTVDLPVIRIWRRGQMTFSYNPSYLQYDSQSRLDHDEERVRFELKSTPSPRSRVELNTAYTLTQEQGNPLDLDGPDNFRTARQDLERFVTSLGFYLTPGKFWNLKIQTGADFARYGEVLTPGEDIGYSQDRDAANISFGLGRKISRNARLGMAYTYGRTKLFQAGFGDTIVAGGNENTNQLAMEITHQVAPATSVNYGIGVFQARGNVAGPTEEREGAVAGFGVEHRFKKIGLSAQVGHSPTSGGGLVGTATSTEAGISATSLFSKRWVLSSSVTWEERNPTDQLDITDPQNPVTIKLPNQALLALGITVERVFKNTQAIRVGYTYIDQWAEGGGGQADSLSYPTTLNLAVGYVWYPLERTSVGRVPADRDR